MTRARLRTTDCCCGRHRETWCSAPRPLCPAVRVTAVPSRSRGRLRWSSPVDGKDLDDASLRPVREFAATLPRDEVSNCAGAVVVIRFLLLVADHARTRASSSSTSSGNPGKPMRRVHGIEDLLPADPCRTAPPTVAGRRLMVMLPILRGPNARELRLRRGKPYKLTSQH